VALTSWPKIGIVKVGCIASSALLEFILDERAEREIEVRVWGSGAKMDVESCRQLAEHVVEYEPDLAVLVSPNASLDGPTHLRTRIGEASVPCLSISDAPSMKAFFKKGEIRSELKEGQGFIIIPSDPLIGARREFLDATEMVIFNSDIMKILAICGVVRGVHSEIDGIVESIRRGESIIMPRIVMDTNTSLEYAQLHNSYSNAKAIAALKMAEQAAQLTSAACFRVSDPDEYIALAAAAHEMVRRQPNSQTKYVRSRSLLTRSKGHPTPMMVQYCQSHPWTRSRSRVDILLLLQRSLHHPSCFLQYALSSLHAKSINTLCKSLR
jgi:methylenetetrahydromethanopterin dehydrogenase